MRHRYVFVAGLHRTGTSLLARMLGAHPDIATIDAPVPENEGCYLQGGVPHTARHGIPGHYAIDPAQHHAEHSPYNTLAVAERMEHDWGRWFDADKPWRLEKSPVNLTRMRLYQQLFPLAHFVVILRHPEAMASALTKWCDRSPSDLIEYGLTAYANALEDVQHLHHCMVVRYEDLCANPDKHLVALHAFLALSGQSSSLDLYDGNAEYRGAQAMTPGQAGKAKPLGYGSNLGISGFHPIVRHPLRNVRELVLSKLLG